MKKNYPFCIKLLIEKFGQNNQSLIKVPKIFEPTNKITWLKNHR